MDLATIESGIESDGVIVALHGVTDSAATLVDLASHWGPRWRVVCVDHPSHGLSPRLPVDRLDDPIPEVIAEVSRVVERCAVGSRDGAVVVYGHSMGGAVATGIALEHPEWVRGLILEDPALLTAEQEAQYLSDAATRSERHALALADPVGQASWQLEGHPNCSPTELAGWLQAKALFDPAFADSGRVGLRREGLLEALQVPTLLVTGTEEGSIFGPAGLEEIAALGNPLVRGALIPAASHVVHRDQLEAFLAVADDFLADLGARPIA